MNQTANYNGNVNEKLETAIDIGCSMVSRAKKVRKKLGSLKEDDASLIESFDKLSDRVTIIDPAIGAPKVRFSTFPQVFDVIKSHGVSENSDLWVISDRKSDT